MEISDDDAGAPSSADPLVLLADAARRQADAAEEQVLVSRGNAAVMVRHGKWSRANALTGVGIIVLAVVLVLGQRAQRGKAADARVLLKGIDATQQIVLDCTDAKRPLSECQRRAAREQGAALLALNRAAYLMLRCQVRFPEEVAEFQSCVEEQVRALAAGTADPLPGVPASPGPVSGGKSEPALPGLPGLPVG